MMGEVLEPAVSGCLSLIAKSSSGRGQNLKLNIKIEPPLGRDLVVIKHCGKLSVITRKYKCCCCGMLHSVALVP
jgi:hypothetical protein